MDRRTVEELVKSHRDWALLSILNTQTAQTTQEKLESIFRLAVSERDDEGAARILKYLEADIMAMETENPERDLATRWTQLYGSLSADYQTRLHLQPEFLKTRRALLRPICQWYAKRPDTETLRFLCYAGNAQREAQDQIVMEELAAVLTNASLRVIADGYLFCEKLRNPHGDPLSPVPVLSAFRDAWNAKRGHDLRDDIRRARESWTK